MEALPLPTRVQVVVADLTTIPQLLLVLLAVQVLLFFAILTHTQLQLVLV
jgi:hypothetical protein